MSFLKPFTADYLRYLSAVFVRQVLLVLGGYSLVLILRIAVPGSHQPVWLLILGLLAFDTVLTLLDAYLGCFFAERISLPLFGSVRVDSLRRMLAMPLDWHAGQNTLELVSKLNSGAGKVMQTAEVAGRELLPALIRTAISLVPLIWFSAATTPLILAGLAAFLWLTIVENRARAQLRTQRHDLYANDSRWFMESVQNVQPLAQFGQTNRILGQYSRLHNVIAEKGATEIRLAARFGGTRNLLVAVTRRISQGIWIWQYQAGSLDAPTVMYLAFLTEELIASFWSYAGVLERIYDGVEPARVLAQLAAEEPSIADAEGVHKRDVPPTVAVDLNNVTFAHRNGVQVLRDFHLHVEPGTVVGLVGRSGIGKTTIQSLLSRMYEAQGGHVAVAGVDVRDWELNQLRGLFAVVSQNGAVFFSGLTVLDTIRFAAPDASFEYAVDAAKCACLHDEILRMPGGYLSELGQGGVNLSKGQAQRLGLAQALLALRDRKVLILDEFTSALDAHTEARVIANLRSRIQGKTVIMIAHRLATVQRLADKIVVIDDGGVVEQGTHRELLSRGEHYAELVRLQSVA